LLTCEKFLQEISDFLDESIDAELRRELEAHISQCPDCFVILDTTKKTIQVYKGVDAKPIPDDVHSRLMRAVEKKCAARRQTRTG
jgi:anti-sigma factor RsiW